MRQVGIVAIASVLEHSRRKLIAFFLVMSALITALLLYFAVDRSGDIFFGSQQNIAFIASMGFLQFFALLAALATSMGSIGRPYSSGEAMLYLARPVAGWQFAIGRYLGSVATTAGVCAVLAIEMQVVNVVAGGGVRLDIWSHWAVVLFNLSVVAAMATLLSVFLSTSIVVAIIAYFVNQGIQTVAILHRLLPTQLSILNAKVRTAIDAAWYLTPKFLVSPLEAGQIRGLGNTSVGGFENTLLLAVWALAWLGGLVAAAAAFTSRKQL